MSLIQRNAVPLFILLAVVAVAIGALLSTRGPVAFGEEPAGCNVSTVGISVLVTDESGSTVSDTYHGAVLNYQVILSIPELPAGDIACNYSGGSLSVVLPNGLEVEVANNIPTVQVGSPFVAPAAEYVVEQGDAIDMELRARARYSGGISHSLMEEEVEAGVQPEAGGSISNTVRISPPGIELIMSPETQLVYLGQPATFDITVNNTGGFSLSNVFVSDRNAQDCEREFAVLPVGGSETYQCTLVPGNNVINEATAIAQVVGGVPEDQSQIEASDSAEVAVETVIVGVSIEPDLQRVRIGNAAVFNVEVTIPGTTALENVTVSVPAAPNCDNALGTLEAGAIVPYTCEEVLPQGTHEIVATVSGEVANLANLTDTAEATVEVFELDLYISIDPEDQTIREGDAGSFTITVGNAGDTILSDVVVSNDAIAECDVAFDLLDAGSEETYECISGALVADVTNTATVSATAPDGGPVSNSDWANVTIMRPSTAIGLSELNTMVLRLVVQILTVTETNDGDSPLTDVYVEVEPTGIILDRDSLEYVGGDIGDDGIMDVGETWEWRVVTVAVAGNGVFLSEDALNIEFTAIGHGIDILGGDVTFPGDAEERGVIEVPIVTR